MAVERVVSERPSFSPLMFILPSVRTRLLRRLEICGSHYHIPGPEVGVLRLLSRSGLFTKQISGCLYSFLALRCFNDECLKISL